MCVLHFATPYIQYIQYVQYASVCISMHQYASLCNKQYVIWNIQHAHT